MEPTFCINPYSMSLLSHKKNEIDICLDKIFMAIVKIGKLAKQNEKELFIYSDMVFKDSYSFKDYRIDLEKRNRDLSYYIKLIQHRSPYYEYISNNEFENLANQKILIYGQEYANANILYFAAKIDGILISVPLERIWTKEIIDFNSNDIMFSIWNLFDDDNTRFNNIVSELFKYKSLLDNPTRFVPTGKIYTPSKQQIYKEINTGYYWYLDYQHKENKKHFEVFDSTGKLHLGEADMNGIINERAKKPGRTIVQYL